MSGPRRSAVPLLALAGAAALAIRIAVLWTFPGNFDSKSFGLAARTAARGGNLYDGGVPYNYAPVWAQVLRGLAALGEMWNVDLIRMIGLTLTAVDLATVFLVYRLCRERLGRHRAALAGLIFFANPVSVLLSSGHGQFDNVAIFFLLAALLLVRREKAAGAAAAASLSLSLLVKHVMWFHPLLFAIRRRPRISLALAAAPYVVFLGSFLPYRESWRSIRGAVFGYRAHTTIMAWTGSWDSFRACRVRFRQFSVMAMTAAVLLLARRRGDLLGVAHPRCSSSSCFSRDSEGSTASGRSPWGPVSESRVSSLHAGGSRVPHVLAPGLERNVVFRHLLARLGDLGPLADRSRKRNSETPRILRGA
jgi:hypothetical protein